MALTVILGFLETPQKPILEGFRAEGRGQRLRLRHAWGKVVTRGDPGHRQEATLGYAAGAGQQQERWHRHAELVNTKSGECGLQERPDKERTAKRRKEMKELPECPADGKKE